MNKVLVTGGNGHLGKRVVSSLLSKGIKPNVLTTQANSLDSNKNILFHQGDLAKNTGLIEAAAGIKTIIHCASAPRNFSEVDIQGIRNLINAIDRNSIENFVYISIVGIDKSDYPYYRAKLEVENIIAESGIPYSILRTTQFHYFIQNMITNIVVDLEKNRDIIVPKGLKFQSVATDEVAGKLVAIALGKPQGLLPDFGGPEVLDFEEMVESYLNKMDYNNKIITEMTHDIRHELFRSGVNLCPSNNFGNETWEEYLKLYID